MHDSARRFLEATAPLLPSWPRVCEIGSRNVNGSVRDLIYHTRKYIGVDLLPGPGVDVVADGATYARDPLFDIVVSTETLEHATDAPALARNLVALCRPGGVILVTAAAPGRAPHSAIDGGTLREGEHYCNVPPEDLREWLDECRVVMIDDRTPGDVYCMAIK